MLKIQEIREIIRLIDESTISEFSYEHEGSQVTIKKPDSPVKVTNTQSNTPSIETDQVEEAPVTPIKEASVAEKAPIENQQTDENVTEIISPMVGTFYRKPSPDSDRFVEIGDNVKDDSIVCIVEAMKLFNEIESEKTGEILEILVSDGELVEYGQALFKVKTK